MYEITIESPFLFENSFSLTYDTMQENIRIFFHNTCGSPKNTECTTLSIFQYLYIKEMSDIIHVY